MLRHTICWSWKIGRCKWELHPKPLKKMWRRSSVYFTKIWKTTSGKNQRKIPFCITWCLKIARLLIGWTKWKKSGWFLDSNERQIYSNTELCYLQWTGQIQRSTWSKSGCNRNSQTGRRKKTPGMAKRLILFLSSSFSKNIYCYIWKVIR